MPSSEMTIPLYYFFGKGILIYFMIGGNRSNLQSIAAIMNDFIWVF